jgi:tetraacyldisaccharide 4'-kinase
LGCLVVVVGNLTVGGTGKTPVVEKFARALRDRGRRVAILSRGYKSKAPPLWRRGLNWITHASAPPPSIVSDGVAPFCWTVNRPGTNRSCSRRNLPGVVVLVDKDRVKAGTYAIKRFGCDTLVLDDGFQYLPLKGSLNLLLVDKTNPFGNGHLLPRGILREPIKHVRRASYVFLTKSDGRRDLEIETLIRQHNPNADFIECAHRPQYLHRFGVPARLGRSESPSPF